MFMTIPNLDAMFFFFWLIFQMSDIDWIYDELELVPFFMIWGKI